jgi:small subunit ribosomal protein S16
MPLKIRLQRQGKKKQPFYHIVVADSRSPRDGRYVERLGTYDPKFDHDGVVINSEKTLEWMEKGATPTDTCRNLLSDKGIMLKKHLHRGVKKGLFTMADAETKYAKWESEKGALITAHKEKKETAHKDAYKQRFEAEKAVRDAKAKAISDKKAAADAATVESVKEAINEVPETPEAPAAE